MKNRIAPFVEKNTAFLISSPINIAYLTGYSNFSRDEREAYLFISEKEIILFTDRRYIEAVEKTIPSSINAIVEKPINKKINSIIKSNKIKQIYFESNLTFTEYRELKSGIKTKLVLKEYFVEEHRMIKDKLEIINMKRAANLTDKTYSNILKNIRMNVTEKELAWGIEKFIKEHGGDLAFDPIVAFGPNASIPHHVPSDKKLSTKDEFVKLDFGAKVNNYCCDMTRTVLSKNSSTFARKIYRTVLDAQSAAIEYINNSKKPNGKKAYDVSSKHIESQGFDSIPHGLGHGIGLEVHEFPHLGKNIDEPLLNNMVFSIEPGIYISNFGGVRIEDTYLYENGKLEQLTKSPKQLTILK